jgi:hypothetical protein
VAVVQYTFTHKQCIEQLNRRKQYIEQHNSLIKKSADHAPSLRGIPWHLPYNWGKSTGENLSQGSRRMPVCKVYMSIGKRVHKHVYLVRYAHISRCWLISYANDNVACIWTARVSDSRHQEMLFFGGVSKREEAELRQGIKREVQEMRDKDRSYFFRRRNHTHTRLPHPTTNQ